MPVLDLPGASRHGRNRNAGPDNRNAAIRNRNAGDLCAQGLRGADSTGAGAGGEVLLYRAQAAGLPGAPQGGGGVKTGAGDYVLALLLVPLYPLLWLAERCLRTRGRQIERG